MDGRADKTCSAEIISACSGNEQKMVTDCGGNSAIPSENDVKMMNLAAKIMVKAHQTQTDKAGQPYILHPMRIAVRCETLKQKTVAFLHDVIEDTDVTPDFLRRQGFSDEIVEAVLSVTRQPQETYEDFIFRCSHNPIGKQVKILDLEDNLNVMRLPELSPSDTERLNKYLKSHRFLKSTKPI